MTEEPTIADNFLATAQALGLDPRLRREALDKMREVNDRMDAEREVGCAGVIEVPAEVQDALRARITPDMQAKQDAARERIRERNARLLGTDREVGSPDPKETP